MGEYINTACILFLAFTLCVHQISSADTSSEQGDDAQDHKHTPDEETVEKVKEHHSHWGYTGAHGVDHWKDDYESCGGDRQSPIDIKVSTTHHDEQLDNIDLLMPSNLSTGSLQMVNNGHTASLSVQADIYISGGNLIDEYQVAGFHFHWGEDNSQGSEHTVNGHAYPIELHIVSYDVQNYATLTEAVTETDALAVLGVLFKVSDEDNPSLTPIVEQLNHVQAPSGEPVTLPLFDLNDLLPANTDDYYRYLGSLTTPGCFESVVWTVFSNPQTISEKQLEQFRALRETAEADSPALVNNYRPVQPLNSRMVCRSYAMAEDGHGDGGHNDDRDDLGDGATSVTATFTLSLMLATLLLL